MSRIVVDTSAYSAFKRKHLGALDAVQRASLVALTPVILGELLAGFRGCGDRHRAKNERELDLFLSSPRVRVLPLDDETSETYAVIHQALRIAGTPIPTNDLWIAASAMQHGLTVLTADGHFRKVAQIRVELLPPGARGGPSSA